MASLKRKVVLVGLARVAAAGAAVAVNIALARGLSRELNGLVQQALIVANVAILLGQSGIQTSCYTFLPRLSAERRRAFFLQSLLLLCGLGLLALGGLWFAADALSAEWGNPRLGRLLAAAGGFVFFSIAASASEAVFLTEERPVLFLFLTMSWAVLHAGGVVALLLLGRPLEWILLAFSVVAALRFAGFALLAWRVLPRGGGGPWLERSLVLQQLGFIAPLAVHGGLDVFSRWLDRSMISTFFSPDQLAVYTYGALELPFVGILMSAVTPVLLPEFSAAWASGDRERIVSLWGRATLRTAALLLPLMFFLYPLSEAFLQVFYSSRYAESSPYLRAYLLLLPVRTIAFTPMLFALGRPGWVLAGAVIDLALNLTLSLWLIPPLGMLGPAVGTVLSTWVQAGLYFVVIGQRLGIGLGRQMPWDRLARLALEAGLVSLAVWGVAGLSLPAVLQLGLGGAIGTAWAAARLRKLW